MSTGAAGQDAACFREGVWTPLSPACQAFNEGNYYHVAKGRAVLCGAFNSYACAVGSNQNAGLNTVLPTWLRMTKPNYYEVGRCP
jgi:hypothetical protein